MFSRQLTQDFAPPPPREVPLLLFSACDSRYVDFAIPLVRSVERFSPGFAVLLHVVNPTDDVRARLAALARELERTRLSVSYETVDLSGSSAELQRTYFACARFLRLPELLRQTNVPVLVLDADSLVVAPIDLDFTNKLDAEVCLRRRDLGTDVPEHVAVATGSVWVRPTEPAIAFFDALRQSITEAFAGGTAGWFVDQAMFARLMHARGEQVKIRNIKSKYADWEFKDDSIVWAAKGERKWLDFHYVLLRGLLAGDHHEQVNVIRLAREASRPFHGDVPEALESRLRQIQAELPARVSILLPRLDLPWKRTTATVPPPVSEDVLDLRLHWKRFATRLANACERAGLATEVLELPAWEIDRSLVERLYADVVLVPHRCKLDFASGPTPVLFYMQEYFRSVFVVDAGGWSAASSVYPVALEELPARPPGGAFAHYGDQLRRGVLGSKFGQIRRRGYLSLLLSGSIPRGRYIFFPLQIPHDQSIRYFSDHEERAVLDALLAWAARADVRVVLKGHPANLESMEEFKRAYSGKPAFWSDANVHDLIAHAGAVYTINSGVGFEALLHGKPVVTFGRAEYDCVTFKAELGNLDDAWKYCTEVEPGALLQRYQRFVDWFLGVHAVDLSRPQLAEERLMRLASDIATLAGRAKEAA